MSAPPSTTEKTRLLNTKDLYHIMQQMLVREHKINQQFAATQEQEYFWVIGLDEEAHILFIELMPSNRQNTPVEPMDVFSLALQKKANKIILCHNHPSGPLAPSDEDKDLTDRLIQVGLIVNTPVIDHQVINLQDYLSFEETYLMEELRQSIKYVPSFDVVNKIRQEAEEIIALTQANVKKRLDKMASQLEAEKQRAEEAEQKIQGMVQQLRARGLKDEEIAELMSCPVEDLRGL